MSLYKPLEIKDLQEDWMRKTLDTRMRKTLDTRMRKTLDTNHDDWHPDSLLMRQDVGPVPEPSPELALRLKEERKADEKRRAAMAEQRQKSL